MNGLKIVSPNQLNKMYQKVKIITQNQYLYIISDEIIGINNKVLHKNSILTVLEIKDNYLRVSELSSINVRKDTCQKIIATSDPNLALPQIPQDFIDRTYGDFKPVDDFVMVEYENRCCGRCDGVNDLCVTDMTCDIHQEDGCENCYDPRGNQLVLVDNIINLKPVKLDLKEEFEKCKINPYYFFTKYCQINGQPATTRLNEGDFNQWILENFK